MRIALGSRRGRAYGSVVLALVGLLFQVWSIGAFDNKRNDNLAVYWGQNSGGDQQRLSYYCQDDVYNVIPLAFLYVFFGTGGEPMMSFAHTCNEGNGTFPDTSLSNCTFLAPDVEECQSKGKIITLSLGGADSSVGFTGEDQAEEFATTIWEMFLGGDGDVRPFGSAVLDGIDLDIEGGLPTYYDKFVDKLRTYTDKADKTYYITAAPQCPFPDASVGPAINQSRFDAIYVQFYNNYCGLNFPDQFDFGLWDTWARTQSPNPDVKIYIGAPGSATAANQGYVSIDVLEKYALEAQGNYTTFGGVMLWDASDAYANNRYDKKIKQALAKNGQDVPDGGSGAGSGSGSGSGGTNSSTPNDGGGAGTNTDGGVGVLCLSTQEEEAQARFAVFGEGGGLVTRDGVKGLYDECRKAVNVISAIARHHVGRLSSMLSDKAYARDLRKYKLYSRTPRMSSDL